MTFNELVTDTNYLCDTDANSYTTTEQAKSFNRHLYKAIVDIYKSSTRFQWDDSNLAALPKIDVTMTTATHEVILPALLKINAVEIKDAAGNWVRLKEMSMDEMRRTISDFEETAGMPHSYAIFGSYIYLLPAPLAASVTLTSGLRFWINREFDHFISTDTTQEPGIAEPFHRICSLGAALDFLLVNGSTAKYDRILQQYEQLRQEIREFYGDMNRDTRINLKPDHSIEDYL